MAGDRVFSVGTTGQLLALDAATGELLWRHDLWADYGGFRLRRGYGASPIAWRETVIVPVGGEAPGAMAFAAADGAVVWRSDRFDPAQSSPIVVEVGDTSQLVLFIQDEVVGLDPDDGALLRRHPRKAFGPYNISTPVAGPDGTIFVSSSYNGGSRLLLAETQLLESQTWTVPALGGSTLYVRDREHILAVELPLSTSGE